MKRIYKSFFKSKKSLTIDDALGSISEPITSTSTVNESTTDTSAAAARAQVTQVSDVTAFYDLVYTSVSALAINEQDVSIPATSVTVAHNLLSASVSNDLAPVSIPAASDNTAHELQVSASLSPLAGAPVAHPERTSPSSSDATMQANLGSTELGENPLARLPRSELFPDSQSFFGLGSISGCPKFSDPWRHFCSKSFS